MPFADDDPILDVDRIVNMLRNLPLFFEVGNSSRYIHNDTASHDKEMLLCLKSSLQKAIPTLTKGQREVISLVGMQGLSECEAALALGISQPAVSQRLKSAATRIKNFLIRTL